MANKSSERIHFVRELMNPSASGRAGRARLACLTVPLPAPCRPAHSLGLSEWDTLTACGAGARAGPTQANAALAHYVQLSPLATQWHLARSARHVMWRPIVESQPITHTVECAGRTGADEAATSSHSMRVGRHIRSRGLG